MNHRTLYNRGLKRIREFCELNKIPVPEVENLPREEWHVGACAYYRPAVGVKICLAECAHPCTENQARNWNWPASVTDREPFGVLCHELGHHCDWQTGQTKYTYASEYSTIVQQDSGEQPITSYAPNPSEWFAEMFRLFVTNPVLLEQIRPNTYFQLTRRWKPLPSKGWRNELGSDVPPKIVKTLRNKGAI